MFKFTYTFFKPSEKIISNEKRPIIINVKKSWMGVELKWTYLRDWVPQNFKEISILKNLPCECPVLWLNLEIGEHCPYRVWIREQKTRG